MHIKWDISNWNIKIIISVLIGAGNPELLSTICLLSATIQFSNSSQRLRHALLLYWSGEVTAAGSLFNFSHRPIETSRLV